MLDDKLLEQYKDVIGNHETHHSIIKRVQIIGTSSTGEKTDVDLYLLDGTIAEVSIDSKMVDIVKSKVLEPVMLVIDSTSATGKRIFARSIIFGKAPLYNN